eukprot:CAMPEP_0198211576 /NCGR_PEP_ID=MMETSP1445-20131203/24524_1 /TAXON_ID=36898 /ORGANISM="Pyramimonas sp., Strain CCMP2087" /LENGTH=334 /DNA_ID=CAMNT_0043885851 /DNA_START=49 /DNA_END=1053 /DNA_ORIENTATION=+
MASSMASSTIARSCIRTSSVRTRVTTTARMQPVKTFRGQPVKKSLRLKPCYATEAKTDDAPDAEGCSVDALAGCTLGDLELMYVDALWNYYHPSTRGKFTLSDGDFDRLKDELYWQGSGFPMLRRVEIDFVEAALAYARGEPVISDADYDVLKTKVLAAGEKRADVTALLLYTKGNQLLEPEEYALLAESMKRLGIEVGLRGASCTLSKTPNALNLDLQTLFRMYAGLGAIPTAIGFAGTLAVSLLYGGPTVTPQSFAVSLAIGAALTTTLARYLDLHNSVVLVGQCPCCETELRQFFGGETPPDMLTQKCSVCGTSVEIDQKTRKLGLSGITI